MALAVPAGAELAPCRDAVLSSLLILFGEGLKAAGRQGAREAGERQHLLLWWEAIRLARALAAHPATADASADALASQLLLHGARLSGRLDELGHIVPLAGQPRDRWDAGMVRLGLAHLRAAQRATRLTRYHVLAGVTRCAERPADQAPPRFKRDAADAGSSSRRSARRASLATSLAPMPGRLKGQTAMQIAQPWV